MNSIKKCTLALFLGLAWAGSALSQEPATLINLELPAHALKKPFTGRVYLMTSKSPMLSVPAEPRWFQTEPFFSFQVKNWQAGEPLALKANCPGYPVESLGKLPPPGGGDFWVAAICDLNGGSRMIGATAGNLFSKPAKVTLHPEGKTPPTLALDQVYQERKFPESEQVRLVEIESKLLSAFHGRPVKLRAGVALPAGYAAAKDQQFPAVYEIPGFGGNHFAALRIPAMGKTKLDGVEVIQVVLDPDCPTGHHVFADSDNNGPYGEALVTELIPQLEKQFRLIPQSWARLVTGHSSGGWSSLWLQVKYPDTFGGVWSTAPDPVDFRDFQIINLYEPDQNMFVDQKGNPRPLGRRGDQPFLFYKPFSDMEVVVGRGGQLGSFEAVFSPKGADGQPRKLWDRKTGKIDQETAQAWKKYDIRLIVEQNWPKLKNKLAGKLHVYMGEKDTFYLEGATRLLGDSFKKLGSNAMVEIFPGKDHSSLLDASLRARITKEMADSLRAGMAK
ncbi:MAG: enterochelin esterase [Gemmataceae bacterium]|nr:enterochelin esterase [Gemmataceae bacterium]